MSETTKYDLGFPDAATMRAFVSAVTELAIADHAESVRTGKRRKRTGSELLQMFCEDWRRGHRRFATGIAAPAEADQGQAPAGAH